MVLNGKQHSGLSLREVLTHLRDAAATFHGGTQITNAAEAHTAGISYSVVEGLMTLARQKGATPFEISRAFQGEVTGGSFLD